MEFSNKSKKEIYWPGNQFVFGRIYKVAKSSGNFLSDSNYGVVMPLILLQLPEYGLE